MAFICINIARCEYNVVQANEYGDVIDYREIQNVIDEVSYDSGIDFKESIDKVSNGEDMESVISFSKIKNTIKESFSEKKHLIVVIIVIVLLTAVFTNLGGTFSEGYVAENSFIVTYMILITALMNSYKDIYKIGYEMLIGLKTFMTVLVPTYSVASYISNGINTSSAYSILSVITIMIVEVMYVHILLPLLTSYVLVGSINNISKKNSLYRMQEFIKLVIIWGLKGSIIVVTGLGTVRRIISPAVDMATKKVISSGLKMTPFIGKNITVVTDTVTSAATLIKNSIGGVSLVIIAVLCITPIIRIMVYVVLYKIIAIIVESIADKRVVNALECIGESAKIFLYIIMSSGLLFVITIAMIAI